MAIRPAKKTERKPSNTRKEVPLNLRVGETEKSAFVRAAEIAGLPLSAWVRARLRAAALVELDSVGEAAAFLVAAESANNG